MLRAAAGETGAVALKIVWIGATQQRLVGIVLRASPSAAGDIAAPATRPCRLPSHPALPGSPLRTGATGALLCHIAAEKQEIKLFTIRVAAELALPLQLLLDPLSVIGANRIGACGALESLPVEAVGHVTLLDRHVLLHLDRGTMLNLACHLHGVEHRHAFPELCLGTLCRSRIDRRALLLISEFGNFTFGKLQFFADSAKVAARSLGPSGPAAAPVYIPLALLPFRCIGIAFAFIGIGFSGCISFIEVFFIDDIFGVLRANIILRIGRKAAVWCASHFRLLGSARHPHGLRHHRIGNAAEISRRGVAVNLLALTEIEAVPPLGLGRGWRRPGFNHKVSLPRLGREPGGAARHPALLDKAFDVVAVAQVFLGMGRAPAIGMRSRCIIPGGPLAGRGWPGVAPGCGLPGGGPG